MGEHGREVLKDVLAMDDAEIAALVDAGAIEV
jgi:hypothetical protein